MLAEHSHEAHQQPEDSEEAAQHGEKKQEVQEEQEVQVRQRHAENEVSEVDIPNVGRITVRADADGYNEEVKSESPDAWSYSVTLLCSGSSLLCPVIDDANSSHAGCYSGHRQGQTDF